MLKGQSKCFCLIESIQKLGRISKVEICLFSPKPLSASRNSQLCLTHSLGTQPLAVQLLQLAGANLACLPLGALAFMVAPSKYPSPYTVTSFWVKTVANSGPLYQISLRINMSLQLQTHQRYPAHVNGTFPSEIFTIVPVSRPFLPCSDITRWGRLSPG